MDSTARKKSPDTSKTMEKFDIKIERSKPCVLEEIVDLLKKFLEYCLWCLSCGCYHRPSDSKSFNGNGYEMILLDSEKKAVQNLLHYMELEASGDPVLTEEHIRAMCILTYSDNEELQKSAALCFTEVSERMSAPLTIPIARPLVELLRSRDIQVQKAATLAVSNFCMVGPGQNKDVLVTCGVIPPLVQLLHSKNVEVQCNTCGCITSLATSDSNKQLIVNNHGIRPLINLMKSTDIRVQRNAAGAILNLTHLQSYRNDLVTKGAIPVLIDILHSSDIDVQYYVAASLSNLAVNDKHRTMMTAIGHYAVIKQLVKLMSTKKERVKCQACFALRNIASDDENQIIIVQFGALPHLHNIIKSKASHKDTLGAAVACLRNLSIHKANEIPLISEKIIPDLRPILCDSSNSEAQRHAAGTLRNLAVGDHHRIIIDNDCIEAMTFVLMDIDTKLTVLAEITAALAILTDEDDVKLKILQLHNGKCFTKLVTMATLSSHSDVQYNSVGILGQLSLVALPESLKVENRKGILLYIDMFLKSPDPNFIHVALWTLVQLLKDPFFLQAFREHDIEQVITKIHQISSQPTTIDELAETALSMLRGEGSPTSSDD
ncbi:uncharacterized protein LOC143055699 isoform X1 [Mytilus galloprovincialis]|uniref:uncharacterized protein LOC143055699 isoform X1 n=2 Tax=Mytilus galloprovincialis TaxID=29158 RepID=UPI003F7B4BFF